MLIINFTMVLVIIQPEKMSMLTLPIMVILFFSVCVFQLNFLYNLAGYGQSDPIDPSKQHHSSLEYKYFDTSGIGFFLGVATFAFESIGTVYNVRRTAKDRTTFVYLVFPTLGVLTLIYLFFSISGYLVHGSVD